MKKIAIIAVVLLVVGISGVAAFAAGALPFTKTISGGGDITVNPPVTPAVYELMVSPTSLNYSDTIDSGDTFSKTLDVTVTNIGTNGSVTPCTINSISAAINAGTPLPTGWTLTSNTVTDLSSGESDILSITIDSNGPVTTTTHLGSLTIDITCN